MVTLAERFLAKVDKSGECWLWTGCLDKDGYGKFRIKKKIFRTHRISYELYVEPIPDGLYVCHHCDNPSCVNPDHLFVGTSKDNMRDMISKSHNRKGQNNSNAKLTSKQVCEIRERIANGEKQITLAKEFGVVQTTVSSIKCRKRWKEI